MHARSERDLNGFNVQIMEGKVLFNCLHGIICSAYKMREKYTICIIAKSTGCL